MGAQEAENQREKTNMKYSLFDKIVQLLPNRPLGLVKQDLEVRRGGKTSIILKKGKNISYFEEPQCEGLKFPRPELSIPSRIPGFAGGGHWSCIQGRREEPNPRWELE